MVYLYGEQNVPKQEKAILKRSNLQLPPLDILENTQICNNCNVSIVRETQEMQADPIWLRLNVLIQTSSHSCFICNENQHLCRLSTESRVNIYV